MVELAKDLLRGVPAIAMHIGFPEKAIRAWIKSGDLPVFSLGGRIVWARCSDLAAFTPPKPKAKPEARVRSPRPKLTNREADGSLSFSFSVLDATLADLCGITTTARAKFSSRLRNLLRFGFGGAKPGRGKTALYGIEAVHRFAFATELMRASIMPEMIVEVMPSLWHEIWPAVCAIIRRGEEQKPIYVVFKANALRRRLATDDLGASVAIFDNFTRVLRHIDQSAHLFNLTAIVTQTIAAHSRVTGLPVVELMAEIARLSSPTPIIPAERQGGPSTSHGIGIRR